MIPTLAATMEAAPTALRIFVLTPRSPHQDSRERVGAGEVPEDVGLGATADMLVLHG